MRNSAPNVQPEACVTLYLDDEDVSSLLSLQDAIGCVDRAFRLLSDGGAVNEVRHRTHASTVSLNVMWSIVPADGVLGVKAYPVVRTDVTQGAVLTLLLYSSATGKLLAVVKADRLGQLRTGAASAVATRALAPPESEVLALYGTGFQAETQVLALAAVMPALRSVRVVGRDPARRDEFVRRMRGRVPAEVRGVEPNQAPHGADVVVTATGSADPVLLGDWVRPGTHVNCVGSNVAMKREVDRVLLERAALIVVDDRDVAARECGDLLANGWGQDGVVGLGDVLTRVTAGRAQADDITVFESQGLAVQDVVCAALVYSRAMETGRGRPI
jgi:ornithine cyclodeaminase/alanine dehydrogenase